MLEMSHRLQIIALLHSLQMQGFSADRNRVDIWRNSHSHISRCVTFCVLRTRWSNSETGGSVMNSLTYL